ncbi:MAG: hypothetical protein AAF206_24970 [Bacteroidota bacterium]
MKKNILLILMLVGLQLGAIAQDEVPAQTEQNVTLSYGFSEKFNMLRLSYVNYWGLGQKKKFRIGPGVRAIWAFGNDWRIATVNTSNSGDGGGMENALSVEQTSLGGVNLGLFLKYALTPKLEIGLNFDVIGIGFGGPETADFVEADNNETTVVQDLNAPNPNIAFTRGLVSSDNLWIGYKVVDNFQLRAAFNFTGAELEVADLPIESDDPRFERINTNLVIGVMYAF